MMIYLHWSLLIVCFSSSLTLFYFVDTESETVIDKKKKCILLLRIKPFFKFIQMMPIFVFVFSDFFLIIEYCTGGIR